MGKSKKKSRVIKSRKRKIDLPVDRYGNPVHIGDTLYFEADDVFIKVESLTYYGDHYIPSLAWVANENEDEMTDNIDGSVNVMCVMEDGK